MFVTSVRNKSITYTPSKVGWIHSRRRKETKKEQSINKEQGRQSSAAMHNSQTTHEHTLTEPPSRTVQEWWAPMLTPSATPTHHHAAATIHPAKARTLFILLPSSLHDDGRPWEGEEVRWSISGDSRAESSATIHPPSRVTNLARPNIFELSGRPVCS